MSWRYITVITHVNGVYIFARKSTQNGFLGLLNAYLKSRFEMAQLALIH